MPLACARACAEVIALARRAGENGYLNVISDGGVGVLARYTGAAQRRAQRVYINAPALKDREFAAQRDRQRSSGGSRKASPYELARAA